MPPPKLKLYKTGKPKTLIKPSTVVVSQTIEGSSTNLSSELDSENVRQFELELAWCIQTMESSLNGGKLNASQVQDTTKTLKILKSSNQSIIRKRQLMRSSFGDYRAKMAEEEKKLRLGRRQIQFSNQTKTKSFFVKRSVLSTIGKDKEFKFDFPATTEQLIENMNLNDTNEKSKSPQHNNGISSCATMDNSFRFNFDIAEETSPRSHKGDNRDSHRDLYSPGESTRSNAGSVASSSSAQQPFHKQQHRTGGGTKR